MPRPLLVAQLSVRAVAAASAVAGFSVVLGLALSHSSGDIAVSSVVGGLVFGPLIAWHRRGRPTPFSPWARSPSAE